GGAAGARRAPGGVSLRRAAAALVAPARQRHGPRAGGDLGTPRHRDQRDDQKDPDGPFAPAAHAFFPPARRSRSIGRRRRAMPVAARMALRSAGGPPFAPVSPMPPGGSPLLMTFTSMGGPWWMRSMR